MTILRCFCGAFGFRRRRESEWGSRTVTLKGKTYSVVRRIGEGGFGYVDLVKERSTGEVYALKRLLCQEEEQLKAAKWEVEVGRAVSEPEPHPNLLRIIETDIVPSRTRKGTTSVLILMPFLSHGTLQDDVDRLYSVGARMDEQNLWRIFLGVCRGVKALHDKGFAHRDLRPLNIMMDAKGHPLLIDYGSAARVPVELDTRRKALEYQEDTEEHCFMDFRAPELFEITTNRVIDQRMDVWALGCTLFAMAFRDPPFSSAAHGFGGSIALAALAANIAFPSGHTYSSHLEEIVRFMLNPDVLMRPFLDDVIPRVEAALAHVNDKP